MNIQLLQRRDTTSTSFKCINFPHTQHLEKYIATHTLKVKVQFEQL